MSFDGNGNFNQATAPVVSGTVISSTNYNTQNADFAAGLTNTVTKDGQTNPTANLKMAGFRHTGVGNAVARTDYAAMGQVQDGAGIWCGTAGGTANALTLTPSPAIPAYAAGQVFRFTAGASPNSGATTVAVSGLTAQAIQNAGAALTGGEIAAGRQYGILYDGASFQLQSFGVTAATYAANTFLANATGSTSAATGVALAASQLAGRGATGNVAAISLGTNLSMSGTTLNASGTTAATQTEQEAAASGTVFVTPSNQQWHPSALKGFCTVTVPGGTPTIQSIGTYNVSSIGDNGVGDFTINWTTAFSSANYALAGMVGDYTSAQANRSIMIGSATTISASAVRVITGLNSGAEDPTRFTVLAAGDR